MSQALMDLAPQEIVDRARLAQLHRHADAYRSLLERSGICMASVDPTLKIQEANEQFRRDLGGSGDVVGRDLFDFLRLGPQTQLRRQFVRLIEGRSERVSERIVGVRADDHLFPGQLTAVPVRGRSPLMASIVVTLQWDESAAETAIRTARHKVLTELDARILQGVAMGMSTVNLAGELYLSRQGVEYHVATMMKKLKAPNRAALVSRAYSMGVLNAGTWPPQVSPDFVK
ncbi:LuxR C-terminal-related transcriptional regulator [Polymorphospora sp. NPDC051019]|uniref:helix-turn-helix transcriptional regulator n=1 Tax=Polymorphospora sp. NPDC051019 TaxID=3155725 RepID=UPI00341CBC30